MKISMMARTMVVLPVPGPPVMTSSFRVIASRIAARWLLAKAIPIFRSAHSMAASALTSGSGCGPAARALIGTRHAELGEEEGLEEDEGFRRRKGEGGRRIDGRRSFSTSA